MREVQSSPQPCPPRLTIAIAAYRCSWPCTDQIYATEWARAALDETLLSQYHSNSLRTGCRVTQLLHGVNHRVHRPHGICR